MNIGTATDYSLVRSVVIAAALLVCGFLLVVMNRLVPKPLYAKRRSRTDRPASDVAREPTSRTHSPMAVHHLLMS